MNPEQFFARLKSAFDALSGKQLGTLAVAFVAVVGVTIGSAYYLNQPSYGVLFSDMEPESASSMASKLKTAKVDYQLDAGGRTIRVPLAQVDELRLQFASDGFSGSSAAGWSLFDGPAFGVTDFQEHINFRRALEGELARTISTISEVAGARVHVAIPQPSLFTDRDQPTKASVILKLKSNRPLAPATTTAITNLVAASVEELRPEHVVIIDNFGRPLSKTEHEDAATEGVPLERQQRIERELATRVVELLEPIVGVGRARVNVSAALNTTTEERTEQQVGETPVMVSRSVTSQKSGMPLVPQGLAGAQANIPPDPADPDAAAVAPAAPTQAQNSQEHETTNYDLSKTTIHTLRPRGDIRRLSVAVLLDDARQAQPGQGGQPAADAVRARTPEELQKVQALVSRAVGLDPDRGDQITVENIAFEETPVPEEPPAPGLWQRFGPQVFEALRVVGVMVVAVLALVMVIRPMVRGALGATPQPAVKGALAPASAAAAGALGAARTVQDLEAEMDAQLVSNDAMKMPVLTKRMATLTQKEPESAARLLRTWLNEDA